MLIFRFSKMNEFSTARFISPRFYFLRDTISQDYYILWGFNYQHFLAETIYSKNSLRIAKKLGFLSEFLKKSDWGNQMVVKLIQNSFIFFLKNSVAVCISNKLPKGKVIITLENKHPLIYQPLKDKLSHE